MSAVSSRRRSTARGARSASGASASGAARRAVDDSLASIGVGRSARARSDTESNGVLQPAGITTQARERRNAMSDARAEVASLPTAKYAGGRKAVMTKRLCSYGWLVAALLAPACVSEPDGGPPPTGDDDGGDDDA